MPLAASFMTFLLSAGAFLPATFPEFQDGPGVTWLQTQGTPHRIDYVAVPASWKDFDVCTRVLEGFEALQLKEDHMPVCLQAQFAARAPAASYVCSRSKAVRPRVASDPALRQRQLETLSALMPAPWHCDVNLQYEHFVHQWTRAGRQLTDVPVRSPRQPFITGATVELLDTCRALRLYLRDEARERCSRLLKIAFAAMRLLTTHSRFSPAAVTRANSWVSRHGSQ